MPNDPFSQFRTDYGGLDAINTGLDRLQKGLQDHAVAGAMRDAQTQIDDARASSSDDFEFYKAARGIANQAALKMAGAGAKADEIHQVVNSFESAPSAFEAKTAELKQEEDFKAADHERKYAAEKDLYGSKQEQKLKGDQDRTLQQTMTFLQGRLGDPAVRQASLDLYSAKKADSLATLVGDPNNMSPQLFTLYKSELAKIAKNGVPDREELKGLDINTMPKALATALQTFVNHPEPAKLGEFIKQYQAYGHAVTDDAKQIIDENYGRVIRTRRKQLGEDNFSALQEEYLNRFPELHTGRGTASGKDTTSSATPGTPQGIAKYFSK